MVVVCVCGGGGGGRGGGGLWEGCGRVVWCVGEGGSVGVVWWWWCGPVCLKNVSVHTRQGDAPNYGSRVPVDTAPGPAPVCRAPKKSTHHSSCCGRQLEQVAAASQRRPQQSMNCVRTSTTASVDAHNGHATTPAQPTSTILSVYCSWRNSTTMGISLCAMTEMSTTTMNCNCGESTVCSSHEDEDRPQDPKVLPSRRKA